MAEYDVFISYSRADDADGWVSGLVDVLVEDHRAFSTTPLRVFFDRQGIRVGDDWKLRLGRGLRSSRVLLVCISPGYFASEYCRWEWEEFTRYRGRRAASADTVTSVYFVQVGDPLPASVTAWRDEVARVQHADVQPWFPQGRQALGEEEVRRRLAELGDQIWDRSQRAALPMVGNLRRHNATFVGRVGELAAVRESLMTSGAGVVTTVHGLGGQGKTELAITYAHVNRATYGGGTWTIGAEGATSMEQVLARLAPDLDVPVETAADERGLARRVIAELERRTHAVDDPEADECLLVLDNVDDPAVLSKSGLGLLPDEPWLHVLATTRIGEAELDANRSELAFIALDGLDADDCYRLLCEHQPDGAFPSAEREAEARELAAFLSGFTLAAEQAAVHLGMNLDDSPRELLDELRGGSGDDLLDAARHGTHHTGTLDVVIDHAWAQLPDRARAAMISASLLPPDTVPWEWLAQLTDHLGSGIAGKWTRIQRVLEGRRLLLRGDEPELGRIHRLVAARVSARFADAGARAAVAALVEGEIGRFARDAESGEAVDAALLRATVDAASSAGAVALAELGPFVTPVIAMRFGVSAAHDWAALCLEQARVLAATEPDDLRWTRDISLALDKVGDIAVARGDLAAAHAVYTESLAISRDLAAADPDDIGPARDVAVGLESIGRVAVARGDLDAAHAAHAESLAIRRARAAADPSSTELARDVAIGLDNMGRVAIARGDLDAAYTAYAESLATARALAGAHPRHNAWVRDVSVSLNSMGGVHAARGDLDAAHAAYAESLAIARGLAAADPRNAEWSRDVSVSLNNVGRTAVARGDLDAATRAYSEALAIARALAAADPHNTEWARDVSVSLDNIGRIALARGDLDGAHSAYGESLSIRRALTATDPHNTEWARDVSVSLRNIGRIALAGADLDAARAAYDDALSIARSLAATDPRNTGWARDVSVTLGKAGDIALARGDLDAAHAAYAESLAIARDLAAADPRNAGWSRDVSVSLNSVGRTAVARGDLDAARRAYSEALAIARALVAADPRNTEWARDESVALNRVGEIAVGDGDLEAADTAFTESLAIARNLAAADPGNADWSRDVSVGLDNLARIALARGDLEAADTAYAESLAIARNLAATDPRNSEWSRDVSISLSNTARIALARGDLDAAHTAYAEALAIRRDLAAASPRHTGRLRDVSVSLDRLGDIALARGDLDAAHTAYAESLVIARRLTASDPHDTGWAHDLALGICQLADVQERVGLDACALWREADAVFTELRDRGVLRERLFDDADYVRGKASGCAGS